MRIKILPVTVIMLLTVLHVSAGDLRVASFNIRYQNNGDEKQGNGWSARRDVVCGMILFHDFDIFGAQEVLHGQLNDMLDGLEGYSYVGVGRDDGKTAGEYSPVFYKTGMFELIEGGHFWLAEDTSYPNVGWDAALPRICTWGRFRVKEDGQVFWFFNLHMDHRGKLAREKSSLLVLEKIREMCNGEPVILTGDFNVDQNNDNYLVLRNSGILWDAYESARIRYAPNGTFNNFDTDLKTYSRIDHIFLSSDFTVDRYGVLTDTYRSATEDSGADIHSANFPDEVALKRYKARLPSDHFPIMAIVSY